MININITELISAGVGIVATGVTWYAHNKGWLARVFPWLKRPLQAVDNAAQTIVTDVEHVLQNGQAQIVIHNLQVAVDQLTQSSAQKSILADVQIVLSALGKSASTLTPTEIGWMVSYVRGKLPPELQSYATTANIVSAVREAESTVSTMASSTAFQSLQEVVKFAGEVAASKPDAKPTAS